MQKFEIPPFYVGQEIVANCDHPRGRFKKGDEFIVTSIRKSPCKCPGFDITIGIAWDGGIDAVCIDCGCLHKHYGTEKYFSPHRFSPKIHLSGFISMKQLAETQLETIGAN